MKVEQLQRRLEEIADVRRHWLCWRALGVVWTVTFGLGLVLLMAKLLTGWGGKWTIAAWVLGATAAGLWVWRKYRGVKADASVAAHEMENEHPRLHGLLLTASEQHPEAGGELNYLQQRVVDEALGYRQGRNWDDGARMRLLVAQGWHGMVLLGCVVVLGLLVLLNLGPRKGGWLVMESVVVTPGDAEVERGDTLVVMARYPRRVPREAVLVMERAGQPVMRQPLVRSLNDPMFGDHVAQVQEGFRYWVEAEGQVAGPYQVSVFERPRLERADATLIFPDYTGQARRSIADTRRITAVEGSRLDYAFVVRPEGVGGRLMEGTNQVAALVAREDGTNVLSWGTTLVASRRLELVLFDDAGRTNQRPYAFHLEVTTNRAPDLKFVFPRGDQRLSPLEEMRVQAEVTDDFGVIAYGFAYGAAGEEPTVVLLGGPEAGQVRKGFEYLLALEDLGVQPDDLISYYLWADDQGPDGAVRRTVSDLYFAEIRPFEEVFREASSAGGEQGSEMGGGAGADGDSLVELQKQIISATWKLKRTESSGKLSAKGFEDLGVVVQSQQAARDQVEELKEQVTGGRAARGLEEAGTSMEKALSHLKSALTGEASTELEKALQAEQQAYRALVRQSERERQVARGQSQGRGAGQGRMNRQLQQLSLKQGENRYETERQAAQEQDRAQQENLQVLSRLRDLARRQEDLNERLKELQTALQEAASEQERRDLEAQLRRLREEQRDMLADVDELNQRMGQGEQAARNAQARQALDQSRGELESAAESLEEGSVGQALASGTRAQRRLESLGDEMRRESSSQFSEALRGLRQASRDLVQNQEQLGQQLDSVLEPGRRTLSHTEEQKSLAEQYDSQRERLQKMVEEARSLTQRTENVEPTVSRQLYDTLRQLEQEESRSLQTTMDELVAGGQLRRSVYDALQQGKSQGKRSLEVGGELVREGFLSEADTLEGKTRGLLEHLRDGVEGAVEGLLGDDVEGLRTAERDLEALERELEREIASREGSGQSAAAPPSGEAGERADGSGGAEQSEGSPQQGGGADPLAQAGGAGERGQRSATDTPGERSAEAGGERTRRGGGQSIAQAGGQSGGQGGEQAQQGEARNAARGAAGGGRFFEGAGGDERTGRGGVGPLLGRDYGGWNDRLRVIEETLDQPGLREETARIRDRMRVARNEFRRHGREPQWPLVRIEIARPVAELRSKIAEELARRGSREALVPIDRDPVPPRYTESVKRYYERLGRSE